MSTLVLLNKPFRVLSQFTDDNQRQTLADYISIPNVYVAGRLDFDSEGLLLLTDDGKWQHKIANPAEKMPKTYWVQVEGEVTEQALSALLEGVKLKDGITKPALVKKITEPSGLWPRTPPIRERKSIPDSWLSITISEGKNRQVRRMTASVGLPTLRLIRYSIGDWTLAGLDAGEHKVLNVPTLAEAPSRPTTKTRYSPRVKYAAKTPSNRRSTKPAKPKRKRSK